MEQAYLLLTGSEHVPDLDEHYGIYTDKDKLKADIGLLKEWRHRRGDNGIQIMVLEFNLNEFAGSQDHGYLTSKGERYYEIEPEFAHGKQWKWRSIDELWSDKTG